MWDLSDRPKVRRTAGRSVSMQPAVAGNDSVTTNIGTFNGGDGVLENDTVSNAYPGSTFVD
jgi:hypothetical protein